MRRLAYGLAVLALGGTTGLPLIAPGVAAAASPVRMMLGYADTLRGNPANFPTPWAGAPKTLFLGQAAASDGGMFNAGAIRLINPGRLPLRVQDVTVDLHHGAQGASGPVFDLWGNFSIPAKGEAILTQTSGINFDTSDYPFEPLGIPAPPSDPRIPTVTVTISGSRLTFLDRGHVLDTRGMDALSRPMNESAQWTPAGRASCGAAVLSLGPRRQAGRLRRTVTVTATLTNGCGEPLPGVRIHFAISSGPNAGESRVILTGRNGEARFRYRSSRRGTDKLRCTVKNPGGKFRSRSVNVSWKTF